MSEARRYYRVTLKVRNANLLRAIERAGFKPGHELASAAGVSYPQLNDLLNMVASPIYRNGAIKPWVERLMFALNATFADLFSDEQCAALDTNRAERDLHAEHVFALMSEPSDSGTSMLVDESKPALDEILSGLSPRERRVLELVYGVEDGTPKNYTQAGKAMGVTGQYVRQIAERALRKAKDHAQFVSEWGPKGVIEARRRV